jgi:hypothetical protein
MSELWRFVSLTDSPGNCTIYGRRNVPNILSDNQLARGKVTRSLFADLNQAFDSFLDVEGIRLKTAR